MIQWAISVILQLVEDISALRDIALLLVTVTLSESNTQMTEITKILGGCNYEPN